MSFRLFIYQIIVSTQNNVQPLRIPEPPKSPIAKIMKVEIGRMRDEKAIAPSSQLVASAARRTVPLLRGYDYVVV